MTSEERREARYQRRKLLRLFHRSMRCQNLGSMDEIFSFRDLFRLGRKCCNGVRWKNSVQRFESHLFSGTARRREQVVSGKWVPAKYVRFKISERGKTRVIDAPRIEDRQVHKVLCQKVLYPLYKPGMIYDNGASMRGKGLNFTYKRLVQHLHWHYRRYGLQGAVFIMDFHQFFPTAPHKAIYERHQKYIQNEVIRGLADSIVKSSGAEIGMPLGVEPSQLEMVSLPSNIDNYIKCQAGIHCARHYMDDYYIISENVGKLHEIASHVIAMAEAMGLSINRRKCHFIPLRRPMKICKLTFLLTETGRVIVRGNSRNLQLARRKLKAFKKKVEAGEMSLDSVYQSAQSQIAYFRFFNDHGRVLRLRRICYALYGGQICV